MNKTVADELIEQAIFRLEENPPRIEKCLSLLTEKEIWQRPNDSSNSIGNLILHLCGNLTQYITSSLGEKEDMRERDVEFATKEGITKEELLTLLSNSMSAATETLKQLDRSDLLRERSVQGFTFSAIGNIIHATEHFSYHTGQIAFLTKLLTDKDLGFYAGLDLNAKNG